MVSIIDNPLPGVPLVESPFVREFFPPESTDPKLLELVIQLNKNGYAVIDFPDENFAERADRIRSDLLDAYDWDRWRVGGANLRLQDAWKTNNDVYALAVNQTLIDLLTTLFGRRAWPFQTLNFPVGTEQHYHTDSVHFSSMPERFMCGVWTALEDVDEDQGPLIYYPGSHKWPIYTNEHIGHRHSETFATYQKVYEPMWRAMVENTGIQPQYLKIRKGQAVIWLANLLHGGASHMDKSKTRWSQVTHYFFDDCSYYTPMNTDLPLGVIDFREPYNIIKRSPNTNKYLGIDVPNEFIEFTSVKRATMTLPVDYQGFNADAYLMANPDVAAAGADAWTHWINHGRIEGRALKP